MEMKIKTTKIAIYNVHSSRVYMVLAYSDENLKLTQEIINNLNEHKLDNEYFTMTFIHEIVGGNDND